MTTANFTGDGQQKTVEQVFCSSDLTAGLHGQLIFLSISNAFLSFTAFLGNVLILIALRKESSLHPPSKLLLRSLATTDLCVGLTAEPLTVSYWMSEANGHWNICRFVLRASLLTGSFLCGVSLWTLNAISVDRLLALLLGIRYRPVVTLKRTYVIVITIWVVSIVLSTVQYWNPVFIIWFWIIVIPLCLLTSVFSYSKIFLTLRHHQNQVQGHERPNQTSQLNIVLYKKAVSSVIWLQLTLIACYQPFGVIVALLTNSALSPTVYQAWIYAYTLVYLNSSLNPIFYCWKIDEVRRAVKDTFRQMLSYGLAIIR